MNYGNDSNNINQNNYSNNVPKPSFSGVLGTGRPEERLQHDEGDTYSRQTQFGSMNYQEQTEYSPGFHNYGNNYNNYQDVVNQGAPHTQPHQQPVNNQFNNNLYDQQFTNSGTSWSYENSNNLQSYENNNSCNINNSYQQTKRTVSYEDIVPTIPNNMRKRNNQSKFQRKQQDHVDNNTDKKSDSPKIIDSTISAPPKTSLDKQANEKLSQLTKDKKTTEKSLITQDDIQKKVSTSTNGDGNLHTEEEEDDDDEDSQNIKNKNNIQIQGTSIKLETDEEIKKWKEERRKMWLLKISNNKEKHMKEMGIKENDLKNTSVLKEASKQKKFIQSIESQVHRYDPKANLNLKVVQREMANENDKILQFIQDLGDANLLTYELTAAEKDKLFGSGPTKFKRNFKHPQQYGRVQKKRFNNGGRYSGNLK
ncbi:similar to Saccharomyces cerevisiae YPL193W RSA1 Protein involved in the assembly of 60S ribosomal subunits [Maudiozyma saulgeensis]|uniref:Similar to Saccharomyces cerevisiae YPL193W RSA1 Protein involved in the assembly of 60S ribosomal subunits n=1 Tax=Maudiozyma saulgeensis TaxID=1789683 RepID=A0A1X7R7B7_9SACH|nr:similar to Saccharomyces cerevisiae YPL193W RSA1 Protein involved in the assembly of 60S ribosomal subunits [Kazachstania saulgeensis]